MPFNISTLSELLHYIRRGTSYYSVLPDGGAFGTSTPLGMGMCCISVHGVVGVRWVPAK